MVRQVQVVLPASKYHVACKVLKSREFVHRLEGWDISGDRCVIIFKIVEKKVHEAIEILNRYGVGVSEKNGTIDIFSVASTKPRIKRIQKIKKKKQYKVSDSLSYEEIYDIVDGQLHLTFDYLALTSVGGMIAAVGLLTDSAVSVVASMLVSPLMGPIVGMTFSAIIWDWGMFLKSFRNELYGVLLCWIWGAAVGFVIAPFIDTSDDEVMGSGTQMSSRGTPEGLLEGLFVAIPSGCGVALGVASDQINPLVGVAISASLLPPVVNSGLAVALGLTVWMHDNEDTDVYQKHFTVGLYSMILFLMNWLIICIFGYIMFKVKRLSAHKKASVRERHLHHFDAITDTDSEMRRRSDETNRRSSFNATGSAHGYEELVSVKDTQGKSQGYMPPRIAKSFGSSANLIKPESKQMLMKPYGSGSETDTLYTSPHREL